MKIRIGMVLGLAWIGLYVGCRSGESGNDGSGAAPSAQNTPIQQSRLPPPPLPDNPPIEPIGPTSVAEVEVTDSWKPGAVEPAALIDREGPRLLVANVRLRGGGWQTSGPYHALIFPTTGRIIVNLAENQWVAVRAAKRLAVQPMPAAPEPEQAPATVPTAMGSPAMP